MGLLSIFKRDRQDAASSPAPSAASQTVQQARTRARRRLIGATLLVLMAIVGFPLLFESQPRPIPVDIPIDIPRPENAAPLAIPPARSQVIVVEPSAQANPASSARPAAPAEPGRAEEPQPAPAPRSEPPAAERDGRNAGGGDNNKPPARAAEPAPTKPPAAASEPRAAASRPSPADAARARALLEGRETKPATPPTAAAPAAAGRFVVQVGAFADAAAAKEVRQKVEKLGLKTYTQVVETSSGSRTRVRVGPIESREQADKVLDRLKAAGVSAVVLTL